MRNLILAAALAVLPLSAQAQLTGGGGYQDRDARQEPSSGRGLGGTDAGRNARDRASGCGCQGPGGLHAGPI